MKNRTFFRSSGSCVLMPTSHRQVRRRQVAFFNVLFGLGVIALVGGVSLLFFSLGWYSIGVDMRNPALWHPWQPCRVTGHRLDYSGTTIQPREKVFFKVTVDDVSNLCALVHLDSWVSPVDANAEIVKFTSKNDTTCFCPVSSVNVFFPANNWSIYKFCYLELTESEINGLVYYYQLMFYGGISLLCLAPFCLLIPLVVWVKTRCFKVSLNWCSGKYAPLN
jgi:hypothetical protein